MGARGELELCDPEWNSVPERRVRRRGDARRGTDRAAALVFGPAERRRAAPPAHGARWMLDESAVVAGLQHERSGPCGPPPGCCEVVGEEGGGGRGGGGGGGGGGRR